MDIVIDFDGTVVTHEFPNIGKDIGAVPVLKELVENGHNLILFTMRSDIENPKSIIEDRGDKIYLDDKAKTKESIINDYLSRRDDIVEVFKYHNASVYGYSFFKIQNTK